MTTTTKDGAFTVGDRVRLASGAQAGTVVDVTDLTGEADGTVNVLIRWDDDTIGMYDAGELYGMVRKCGYDGHPLESGEFCDDYCKKAWAAEERAAGENYYQDRDEA